MAKNHYGEVTNRILAQLEAGAPPWIKEWKSIGRGNIPKNAVTKRPYSGGNVIFLWAPKRALYMHRIRPTKNTSEIASARSGGFAARNSMSGQQQWAVSPARKSLHTIGRSHNACRMSRRPGGGLWCSSTLPLVAKLK
jgi:hypothetical protein